MKIVIRILLSLLLGVISQGLGAAERPKVGLVLSGGGAKGAAHVGVLRVLEEKQVPIDVITGTSMGSIVGGLYASGMSPAEIENALKEMDWDDALKDDQSRADQSQNRKAQEDLFSIAIAPGFSDGKVKLPPGAIQGQKVELALQRLTTHVAHVSDFDDLPIPFRAVATDIVTGEGVVLAGGNLGRAMRASMSVPGAFAPIKIEGRILVDGGIADNLPVDLARRLGADVLIVVDIASPLRTEAEIGDLLTITDQLTRILTGRNVAASRAKLSSRDVLVLPELGGITASDFDRVGEAVPLGESAARAVAGHLSSLTLSDADYGTYLAGLNKVESGNRTVRSISLNNTTKIADDVLQQRLDIEIGEPLSLDQLERDIGQIHGIGTFEKVGYDLTQHQDGVDIGLYATPKSWGPNYLHFGLAVDGDFRGENSANFILGYTKTEMNSKAGDWTTLLQVGEEPWLLSYIHQPLSMNLGYFVQPSVSVKRTNVGVFDSGDKLAEYRVQKDEFEFLIGREFATEASLSIGINRLNGKVDVLIGDPSLPEADFDDGGAIIKFRYDTLDDIDFPLRGNLLRASYYQAFDSLGADTEYKQWQLRAGTFRSFGQHTIGIGTTLGGTEDGTASLSRRFLLGGFLNISGLKQNELSGEYMGLAQAVYYRRFDRIKFLPAYVGGTFEYGGAWLDKDDISADNSLFGGSLFLGLDSPLGPVLLGYGYTDEGDHVVFTKLGRFFD